MKELIISPYQKIDNQREDIIYMGNWCNIYSKNKIDKNKVAYYHWDDRDKAFEDALYLLKLRERLINQVSENLNIVHNVDNSVRYWDLIIGYWLNIFLVTTYDRWSVLKEIKKNNDIYISLDNKYDKNSLITDDTYDSVVKSTDDNWNLYYISEIAKYLTNIEVKYKSKKFKVKQIKQKLQKLRKSKKFKSIFLLKFISSKFIKENIYSTLNFIPKSNKKVFAFYESGLNLQENIFLNLISFNKIITEPKLPNIKRSNLNIEFRNWEIDNDSLDDDFSIFFKSFIPKFMPKIFLEGYKSYKDDLLRGNYIKKIDLIFTKNAHFSDDSFKIWSAELTEKFGTKLLLGLHGGGVPHKFNFSRTYEKSISDFYLFPGLVNKDYKKSYSIGFYMNRLPRKWNTSGKALLIQGALPRYTFDMRSYPFSSQIEKYFNDLYLFYENIPKNMRSKIIPRIYPKCDYEYDQRQRWLDKFPNVSLDEGDEYLHKISHKYRLIISTYCCTGFCETLSSNIPSIIFWDSKVWQVSDSSKADFNLLSSVGIFHNDPLSAANQLVKVWNDVEGWWNNSSLQKVRYDFCQKYSYLDKKPLIKLRNIIQKLT